MASPLVIAGGFAALILSTLLPLVLLIVLKIKTGKGLLPALVGALCFVVFAMVLEQLLHAVMLPLVANSAVLYCLYGCLAAGVFEETGRLSGLWLLCRKDKSLAVGVGYGLGHGGIEAVLLCGVSAGMAVLAALTGGGGVVPQAAADSLLSLPSWNWWMAGVERLLAMTAHMALSLLIWMVIVKRLPFWFYPVAIGLHALLDLPACLYQAGVLKSIVAGVELPTLVIVLAIAAFVWGLYRHTRQATADSTDAAAQAEQPSEPAACAADAQTQPALSEDEDKEQ